MVQMNLKTDFSHSKQGVFLTCTLHNNETIKFRVIPDIERQSVTLPQSSKEHQNQGGYKATIEKIKNANPDAWKIEVTKTMGNKIMEIGFGGNETNWDVQEFENSFISILL